MKHRKDQPRSPAEVPAKPVQDVPKVDRERAENEGMTVKPNRDSTNREEVEKAKTDAGSPETDGLEGEGSYEAGRRYREGLERSVKKGDAEKLGTEAAKALDGPEGDALRAAEKAAKRGRTPEARPPERQKQPRKDAKADHTSPPVSHR